MKNLIIAVAVILVLVVAIGWVVLGRGRNGNDSALAQKIEVIKRDDFQMRISATGNLEPLIDVEIKSNVEGEIVELLVKNSDYVEKDQVLLRLDPELYEEGKKQAEADVAAAKAQVRQAELNIELKNERLESQLTQADADLKIAQANLETVQATTITQVSQAETDIQTTQNSLDQDNIALEQARIALEQAKITLSEQETSLKSAKISMDNAKSELDRNTELFEKGLVSKKALEDAQAAHANAEAQYETAGKRVESQKQTIVSQQRTINVRESSIANREAILENQRLNLDNLKKMRQKAEEEAKIRADNSETQLQELMLTYDNEKLLTQQSKVSADANKLRRESSLKNEAERLEWTTIRAPMAGVVTLLELEEGEIVTSGRSAFSQSPPIMTIVDPSKMVVKTFINEVDMERLRLDQRAEIVVDAFQNKTYDGKVYEISPSGQEQDNIISFEVMVEVLGSPEELRPGMSADVDIITYEEKNVLLAPIDAVINEKGAIVNAQVGNTSPFKPNQSIVMQTISEKTFNGTVENVGNGSVTIRLDGSQRGIMPGPTTISLLVRGDKKANGVSAQVNLLKGKFVMLDDGSAKGKRTAIETGMQNETQVIINSGVTDGDRVVLQQRKPPPGSGFGR
ncbi:MAG: HlyD family efflux transporter periplasmic adaptor subunit [Candidatus Poribacteria bacterium]|nr:HlyD family efflux transporter periplasmic adaptor subunit [Candidatus Poribacteria bacterium]